MISINKEVRYEIEMSMEQFKAFEYIINRDEISYGYFNIREDEMKVSIRGEETLDEIYDRLKEFIAMCNTKQDLYDEELSDEEYEIYHIVEDMIDEIYYEMD
jgi:hypothetical protein